MHLSWVFIAHLVPHVQLLVPWGFFLDFRERYAWNGTHDDNEFSTSKWSYKVYQWWYVVVAGDNSALVGHSGSILAAIDLLDPGFRGPKQQAKRNHSYRKHLVCTCTNGTLHVTCPSSITFSLHHSLLPDFHHTLAVSGLLFSWGITFPKTNIKFTPWKSIVWKMKFPGGPAFLAGALSL